MTVLYTPRPDLGAVYQALVTELDALPVTVAPMQRQPGLWTPPVVRHDRQRFNAAWAAVAERFPGLTRADKEALWCQWRANKRRMQRRAA